MVYQLVGSPLVHTIAAPLQTDKWQEHPFGGCCARRGRGCEFARQQAASARRPQTRSGRNNVDVTRALSRLPAALTPTHSAPAGGRGEKIGHTHQGPRPTCSRDQPPVTCLSGGDRLSPDSDLGLIAVALLLHQGAGLVGGPRLADQ
jgi:hypothetical protein